MADDSKDKLKLLYGHLRLFKSLNDSVSVGAVKVENGVLKTYAIDGTLLKESPLDLGKGESIPLATKDNDGRMSKEYAAKLDSMAEGANRVTYDDINGHLTIDGVNTQVYKPETFARDPVDVFNEALK